MTALRVLEMLAREAPDDELEAALATDRATEADPARRAELDRAAELAARIRGTLERARRREAELTALYETVGDLAALTDLDAVLHAIVRRARGLLGTDVAYLTLIDEERGDTYMRVTEGSVSARFQRVRLEMGAGLGGLVAQSASPYATANYFTDARFRHTGDIDGAVTDEGLVAILGVPLTLGSRVIGVLFAANRGERPFAREEVALLCSLAAHAAVAIDNARLLAEARDAHATVAAHSAAVERASDAHARLADLVLRGGGVADVAEAVAGVLGGTLTVLDAEHRPLADTGTPARRPDPARLGAVVDEARHTGHAVADDGLWVAAATAGSEHLGTLVLAGRPDLGEADLRILERAALVTSLLLLFRRSAAEAAERARGELLDDLFRDPHRDPAGLRTRARRLDADLDTPSAVVVARVDALPRHRLLLAASSVATAAGGLAGEHDGDVVLLVPGAEAGDAAARVASALESTLHVPVTCGGGGPAGGPEALAAARVEARRCLDALRALGRDGEGAGPAELGFVGLVLGGADDVSGFVSATVGAVLAYDARRGTALAETLEEYFATGASPRRAAERLHVHPNTVAQRLDRVTRLLGEGWAEPDRALEIQLALRLHRLRSVRRSGR